MVAVSQDVDFAFSGQTVTLEGTSLSGDRARFKLTAKPLGSGLELFSEHDKNYLVPNGDVRAVITPDAPGTYTVVALDESVTVNVKHFTNDGGTALSKGIATSTTVGSASYTLYVGEVMQRELGVGEHRCTLTVHVHGSDATSGVLTYRAGKGYRATITSVTTPQMDLAIRSSGVSRVLKHYGLSSTSVGTATMLPYSSFAAAPADLMDDIRDSFYHHIAVTTSGVHDAIDSTNTVTESAPTSLSELISYSNGLKSKLNAHLLLGTGAAHPAGADSLFSVTASDCSDKPTSVTLLSDIRSTLLNHRLNSSSAFSEAHYRVGDDHPTTRPPWDVPATADSTSTIITFATRTVTAYNTHLLKNGLNSTYHHSTVSTHQQPPYGFNSRWEQLRTQVNDTIKMFENHASNLKEDGVTAAAHTSTKDVAGKVLIRAADKKTTVEAIELMGWTLDEHLGKGGGQWHNSDTNAATALQFSPNTAVTRLQFAILDNLLGPSGSTTPPNTLDAVTHLVNNAAFSKAE